MSYHGQRWLLLLAWLLLALISAFTVANRLQLSFDLSAFLPSETTLRQQVLLEQLKNGPGSRLLVVGLSGAPRDRLAEVSDELKRSLADNPLFLNVANGEFDWSDARIPAPLDEYYLLLNGTDFSVDALRAAFESRLIEMGLAGGSAYLNLVARDPFLASVDLLRRLAPAEDGNGMWFAADGSAVLLMETRADAVDLRAQAEAIDRVHETLAGLEGPGPVSIDITGVGAFGVELQGLIRSEAAKRSALAALALALVLLVVYRRLSYIAWAGLPLSLGFLVGLALLTLVFDKVHGITLAFGFTLMGIAIDYPLHWFSHMNVKGPEKAIDSIWKTMRLGAASTALAYLVLAFSGSAGLAQLGIFTSTGVMFAVLATRYLLPAVMRTSAEYGGAPGNPVDPVRNYWPAVLALTISVTALALQNAPGLWDDDISSLSPVSEKRLQKDGLLRSSAASPDMRFQLVLADENLERLLERLMQLDAYLGQLKADGLIESWQMATHLLSTESQQLQRRESIPERSVLAARIDEALAGTPFSADAFDPFVEVADRARTLPPLGPDDFRMTPLAAWLESHLVHVSGQWVGLVSLSGIEAEPFRAKIMAWGNGLQMVDLQDSARQMMRDYRRDGMWTIGIAAALIALLLFAVHRHSGFTFWVVLNVAAGVCSTFALLMMISGQLNVIHLVALLLVIGLGLDYALFLGRREPFRERRATVQAVTACAASTTLAFAILAASSIPLLHFLGLTVAIGSAVSFLLAGLGSADMQPRFRRSGS